MKDETGGLQYFLFAWCGLPRTRVVDTRGEASELYLENIAPLFYIDQNEGWTDLQSLQVHRYGLLEIADIAVEYLLGATEAIEARFAKQTIAAMDARLKAEASAIAMRVNAVFHRHGWIVEWSDHGSLDAIAKRWAARSLALTLKAELNVDLERQHAVLRERAIALREHLTKGKIDPKSRAASSDSSQVVVELKERRHARREDLRVLRRQRAEQVELLENIEHRFHSARDILRLKSEGIGRIEFVECPTCHRSIDPATFELTNQSTIGVQAHIDALARDKRLVASNVSASEDQIARVSADLAEVENRLRESERALAAVNQAVGASREQLTKIATDLVAAENELDRVSSVQLEIRELQASIDSWVSRTSDVAVVPMHQFDLLRRKSEFTSRLRLLLQALGHGAILAQPDSELRLDEHYVPYLGPRRLRSLGSASDHSRLVAAYVLALAAASGVMSGLHPGFVVLDEPLQQNPDEKHRRLFIDFLTSDAARALSAQTLVFTWLHPAELARLVDGGVRLISPSGEHFLELVPPPSGETGVVAPESTLPPEEMNHAESDAQLPAAPPGTSSED
jgi:DNA repair exonuclease SbcCD ATPase subunit